MTTPQSNPKRTARRVGAAFVLALAISGAILGTSSPASATPQATHYIPVYSGPTPYAHLNGGIFGGTPIAMICWVDSAWAYGTNRWFLVQAPGYNPYSGRPAWQYGYVSANHVRNQVVVRHC